MGEYVWTTFTIGGAVKTADVLEELVARLDEWEQSCDRETVLTAAKSGQSVVVAGERNYGNDDDLDAFLTDNDLAFSKHWCAKPGLFEAGISYWRPGMKADMEVSANDNNDPAICLKELRRLEAKGKTLAEVIAELAEADSVPPLTIDEAALMAAEPV